MKCVTCVNLHIGPAMWGELFPDQCGTSMHRQSPININVDDVVHDNHLDDISIIEPPLNDTEKRMYLYNNGHSGIENLLRIFILKSHNL